LRTTIQFFRNGADFPGRQEWKWGTGFEKKAMARRKGTKEAENEEGETCEGGVE